MRSAILAAAAQLALATPMPEPLLMPKPQGVETNPITGLLFGLIEGAITPPSLESTVPAIISDLGNLADSAGTVTRKSHPKP